MVVIFLVVGVKLFSFNVLIDLLMYVKVRYEIVLGVWEIIDFIILFEFCFWFWIGVIFFIIVLLKVVWDLEFVVWLMMEIFKFCFFIFF